MKPKLTDVANLAGVSLATADRVINNRPGVRQVTRQKVLDAVSSLGYQPNANATNLAKTETRTIAIILPTEALGIYRAVVNNWNRVKKSARYDRVDLQLMPFSPLKNQGIFHCFLQAEMTADGVILCASDHPEVHEQTRKFAKLNIITHTFMTGLSDGAELGFVGVDSYKLGRTVAYFMMLLTEKSAGAIQSHFNFHDVMAYRLRIEGQQDFINEQGWTVELIGASEDGSLVPCGHMVRQQAQSGKTMIGVICLGDRCLDELIQTTNDKNLFEVRPKIILITMDMTVEVINALLNEKIDAIFFCDAAAAMESAIECMIDALDAADSVQAPQFAFNKSLDVKFYVKENLPNWCHQRSDDAKLRG